MAAHDLNELLMKAVEDHDVFRVKDCLMKGANANYIKRWDGDATHQPDSPLRMVVFRISDNFLEDRDMEQFAQIAELLLQYGAQPQPAQQLARSRYGNSNPEGQDPFTHVLRIIERASTR